MVALTAKQRDRLSEKVADAANLALGALVFGQFLAERPFSLAAAVAGFALWLLLLAGAVALGGPKS